METIVRILAEAGMLEPGFYIHIDNPPWMPLSIEDIQQNGPNGLPTLSVAHYGELNGDLMRDPEMLLEMRRTGDALELLAYYWRNDYLGIEQHSSYRDEEGRLVVHPAMKQQHQTLASMWDRNLRSQGFLEAFQHSRNR